MRQFILITFFCIAGIMSSAEEKEPVQEAPKTVRTDLKTENFEPENEAEQLLKKRSDIIAKMQMERVKIIKTDAKAKELHKQLMELYRQLAIVVDSKPAMKTMNKDLQELDKKIGELEKKSATNQNTK